MSAEHSRPHSIEAESGALGCVLSAASQDEAVRLLDKLDERHFHDARALIVFRALVELQFDNHPVDPVALNLRLNENRQLQTGDGADFVLSLPDKTPSPANFPTYLNTLDDMSARRQMLADAEATIATALDTRTPIVIPRQDARIRDLLAGRQFNFGSPPPEVEPRFYIGEIPICTPGNITTLSAQAKQGKTSALAAAMSATMTIDPNADCLGWKSSNQNGLGVLHFDTEQSIEDHHALGSRVIYRAGLAQSPDWFKSYCLTGFTVADAREAVRLAMDDAVANFGGVHSVFIDGCADLVRDVNDPAESNEFVAVTHADAIKFSCPIICAIHLNPGSDFKTRGHLGSQLERKAETNLKLERDGDAVILYADKNRKAPITKNCGPRFAWSSEHGMHVSIENKSASKEQADRQELKIEAEAMFTAASRSTLRHGECIGLLRSEVHLSESTAKRHLGQMFKLGVLKKELTGFYVLNT